MRITHVNEIYEVSFMPRLFPVNCYLIEEQKGLTLIDTALPYSTKGIIEAARQIGKPITTIILTHAHGDHVGSLDFLKQTLPEVPVHISARDARVLAGDLTLDPMEAQTPIRGGLPKNVKTKPDVYLQGGETIGSLLAISTPGHTPGSMAFLDTRTRSLIAGDAFQTRSGVAVSGQLRFWFPFPAMATWHKETALASARRLLAYEPALLAVGHGVMVKEPQDIMKRAISEAEKRLYADAGERVE